ncbi:DUF2892 domain-containing protein [Flavobacterium sp. NST-5]|uniref:DUF2892 domain-containing protein n=1 Tax=Flavobacterium ichthyis TaxID=2698827 RepID=A0ABW9ZAI8_9FLAO|nr:DUF2892 domain-containing protein [Flavobacterium ichthyis]NBL65156.1 DUF2892 domain-containing protein [Flavobacterium ichthyis]
MKKNMGVIDKSIRFAIVILIGILYFTNVIGGTLAIVLGVIAVAFIVTSFVGFCPLYLPFGINTRKK